jgi:hypothetical protein
MTPAGFKPAIPSSQQPQALDSDRSAAGIGYYQLSAVNQKNKRWNQIGTTYSLNVQIFIPIQRIY